MNKINRFTTLNDALEAIFGDEVSLRRRDRIYGGDINDAFCLTLSNGSRVFMKANSMQNANFFTAEALGLWALGQTGEIGVPEALGTGIDKDGHFSFLLMEFIEKAPRNKTYWETFGHQLAALHRCDTTAFVPNGEENGTYGFLEDNFIGANVQRNTPKASWIDFYRECRLLPQIRLVDSYLDASMRKGIAYLLDHLDSFLPEPDFPSLLHGDLWSGNTLCGSDGTAWILDPAAYVGHSEADLAMTQLFGGFPETFYRAYHEVLPIDSGYDERRDMYHLYHLLNHLNLFGRSYLGEVKEVLKRYTGL